jgi:hypothetical protein
MSRSSSEGSRGSLLAKNEKADYQRQPCECGQTSNPKTHRDLADYRYREQRECCPLRQCKVDCDHESYQQQAGQRELPIRISFAVDRPKLGRRRAGVHMDSKGGIVEYFRLEPQPDFGTE